MPQASRGQAARLRTPPLDATCPCLPVLPSRWGRHRPHPSQTRTSAIRASGSSRESFAHSGVGMDDPGWRQRVALQDRVHAGPSDHTLAISPGQPPSPNPHYLVGEPLQPSTVATNTVVGVVAPHHCRQVAMLVADRSVPVLATPFTHRGQCTGKSAFGRNLPDHVPASP